MTTFAVVLMIVAVVLTFVSLGALDDSGRRSGTDRSGSRILFGFTLFLRWTCLAVVLGICAARGGFGWPASTTGQVALVLAVHTVLGLVSFMSAVLKDMPSPALSDRMVAVMGWVPILLPAFQAVAAVNILFPGTIPNSLRTAALILMGVTALAAVGVLTGMFVREERQNRAAAPS
jgi:hypothetical protein